MSFSRLWWRANRVEEEMTGQDNVVAMLVSMAQTPLANRPEAERTPANIRTTVESVATVFFPAAKQCHTDSAIRELILRFSHMQANDSVLENSTDHEEWLSRTEEHHWYYWNRYRDLLLSHLPPAIVSALDDSTTQTLSLLESPKREGAWDRRGLVVGHVQSGKTSHYSGLICKAADAGYKVIIVLAGLHNNLRAQTQIRLEEAFLGYNTVVAEGDGQWVGVGLLQRDPQKRPNSVTTRAEDGDFRSRVREQLGVSPEERPWLFVVKKNVRVLKELRTWLQTTVASRNVIDGLPLLMIDDESDHGSIDTNEQYWDENDGTPDMSHDPTATNREIRAILKLFRKKAYVAYTATPFANIFIHDAAQTEDEGDDLFPRSFIVNLSAASNYIGPHSIFGTLENKMPVPGARLLRAIDDTGVEYERTGWMPSRHGVAHRPTFEGEFRIPASLVHAIDAFLLSTAIRAYRGQGDRHASMLVHVTRYVTVQGYVEDQISEHLNDLKGRLRYRHNEGEILDRLFGVFTEDLTPTHRELKEGLTLSDEEHKWPSWEELLPHLYELMEEVSTRVINGTAGDILDYGATRQRGLKVIAIGGDKLARGLTLEGLSVSYFLRAAGTYDTLMQMGRWFGYRDGYLDVCRLYTSESLMDWFEHVTDAATELRDEFDRMASVNATPNEYGLKVQAHPTLMVTARNKMRNARRIQMDCGGHSFETTVLPRDETTLERNLVATRKLLRNLGEPLNSFRPPWYKAGEESPRLFNGDVWRDVPAAKILQFLDEYVTHSSAPKTHAGVLKTYIELMNKHNELSSWTVAVLGGDAQPLLSDVGGEIPLRRVNRRVSRVFPTSFTVKSVSGSSDEALDLCREGYQEALAMTVRQKQRLDASVRIEKVTAPSRAYVRDVRGYGVPGKVGAAPNRGLLVLYALQPIGEHAEGLSLDDAIPPVGFMISFPSTRNSEEVEYAVNNVLWSAEQFSHE